MDRNLNSLLKWGIEHSTPPVGEQPNGAPATTTATATAITAAPEANGDTTSAVAAAPTGVSSAASRSQLNPEIIAALFGGPSESELMKAAIEVITSADAEVDAENRLIAFDNFEQLIESLDNANNLENLGLWKPLVELLGHGDAEFRRMAAWCVGTAVQNNERTQERLVAVGGIAPLAALALADAETPAVRRKAIYALSSAVRNYQPAMDETVAQLGQLGYGGASSKIDASDMDAVDEVINGLRNKVNEAAAASAAV